MKMMVSLCLTLCIMFVSFIPIQAHHAHAKGLWIWNFYEAASDPAKINQLLKFLTKHKINLVFISTGQSLTDQPAAYEQFIRRAQNAKIRVFALTGDASWALESNHQAALEELRRVLAYNAAYPKTKFDGIQYDIEPYILPIFHTDKENVSRQYLQVLQAIKDEMNGRNSRMEFNAAIPFWYATGESPVILEINGESKPLSFHVLDIVDSAAIMSYRDTAENQIRISRVEVEYASQTGKKVYVSSETNPPNGSSIPHYITYYDEDIHYMNQQLAEIVSAYRHQPGFGGIAIHHYPTFKEMTERDP